MSTKLTPKFRAQLRELLIEASTHCRRREYDRAGFPYPEVLGYLKAAAAAPEEAEALSDTMHRAAGLPTADEILDEMTDVAVELERKRGE